MKKTILIVAFALTTTVSIFTGAQAQPNTPVNSILNLTSNTAVNGLVVTEESSVHAKVLKAFNRHFKTGTDVRWSTDEKFYQAYFTEDGVQNRVTYRKNGQMVQSLKTYAARDLNKEVRAQVEEAYDGYEITGVTEITNRDETVYFVNIESRRKLKEIVAYRGDLMVRRQFDLQ